MGDRKIDTRPPFRMKERLLFQGARMRSIDYASSRTEQRLVGFNSSTVGVQVRVHIRMSISLWDDRFSMRLHGMSLFWQNGPREKSESLVIPLWSPLPHDAGEGDIGDISARPGRRRGGWPVSGKVKRIESVGLEWKRGPPLGRHSPEGTITQGVDGDPQELVLYVPIMLEDVMDDNRDQAQCNSEQR